MPGQRNGSKTTPPRLAEIPAGAYVKGHGGHTPRAAEAAWNADTAVIFLSRNLRDVAVSQAHHIRDTRKEESGIDLLKHPGKADYAGLTLHDTIKACIVGRGKWPGIADRWRLYQGWLTENWVLHITFEDMIERPEETGEHVIRYVLGQCAAFCGVQLKLSRRMVDSLVAGQMELVNSITTASKRKGKAGGWLELWSDDLEDAFISSGAYAANEALGYESS